VPARLKSCTDFGVCGSGTRASCSHSALALHPFLSTAPHCRTQIMHIRQRPWRLFSSVTVLLPIIRFVMQLVFVLQEWAGCGDPCR